MNNQPIVFSKEWFELHQKKLLKLANTKIGRRLLHIHGNRSSVGKNKIIHIGPSFIEWNDSDKVSAEFRTHAKFSKRLYYGLKPLWKLSHLWDMSIANNLNTALNLGFDTLTVNPVPGATVDGMITVDGSWFDGTGRGRGSSWSDMHNAAGAHISIYSWYDASNTTMDVGLSTFIYNGPVNSGEFTFMDRAYMLFDTSSIGNPPAVTGATLSIYGIGASAGLGNVAMHIVQTSIHSDVQVIWQDWGGPSTTSLGAIDSAGYNQSGWNDGVLNGAGLAVIAKTGITRLAMRTGWDLANSPPTWIGNSYTTIGFYSSDWTGTSNDPKLVVTYIPFPTVTTQAATSVATTTATGNGNVTNAGSVTIDHRGVVYDTVSKSLPGNVAPASSGYASSIDDAGSYSTGAFTRSLTGLSPSTTYYMRAYSHNSTGYSYGSEVSFTTTSTAPIVTTQAVSNISGITATGNGNVTDGGSSSVTARGVCWATTANPVASGSHATVSGTTGAFTAAITGLSNGTLYHVRAYATNSAGTSYGADVTFTTSGFTTPGNVYVSDNVYATSPSASGDISIQLSGDAGLTYSSINTKTFTSSDTVQTFGNGSTELWGNTWLGSNVSDTNFRLKVIVGGVSQVYKTFGFAPGGSVVLTGIEVTVEAKWDGTTTSIDQIRAKIYYGTSTTPVQAGALAFATDGGAAGTGALEVYNGSSWLTLAPTTVVPTKATGTDIDTGTDDTKFVTAKSINDSHNVPDVAPGTAGNVMQSDGTDWGSVANLRITGEIVPFTSRTAPSGWLNCDGSTVSRTTYATLFATLAHTLGSVTCTSASPGVVTNTAHGLSTGDSIYLTGTAPTGLAINTLYYIVRIDANSYNLSTTRANAYAGTKINTSSTGSGLTAWDCPYGLGDGSTTFTLPDFRGRTLAGMDTTGGTAASRLTLAQAEGVYGNLGASGGEQGHVQTSTELASHNHTWQGQTGKRFMTPDVNNGAAAGGGAAAWGALTMDAAGSSAASNVVQPTQLVNYIIKT